MVTGLLNNNKSQTRPELLCMCVFGGRVGWQVFIGSFVRLLLFHTGWEFLTTTNVILFLEINVIIHIREK